MTVINAAMITVFVPGKGVMRFAPQNLSTDPTQPAGSIAFPLTCDATFLSAASDANSKVTVVQTGVTDPMYITNISVNVDHYGDGTHQIVGDC